MSINWQLGAMPDIAGNALNAFQQGQQQRREQDQRNALTAYATNPNDQSFNALLPTMKPEQAAQLVQQRQEYQAEQAATAQKTRIEQMGTVAQLLKAAKANPALYPQILSKAQSLGIPIDGAPQQFDPAWVDSNIAMADAFMTKGPEAFSNYGKIAMDLGLQPGTQPFNEKVASLYKADQVKTIPYTQGGGVAGYNPVSGEVVPIIQPNDGSHPVGAPASGAVPPPPPGFHLDQGGQPAQGSSPFEEAFRTLP